jgi:hypothetical protein
MGIDACNMYYNVRLTVPRLRVHGRRYSNARSRFFRCCCSTASSLDARVMKSTISTIIMATAPPSPATIRYRLSFIHRTVSSHLPGG